MGDTTSTNQCANVDECARSLAPCVADSMCIGESSFLKRYYTSAIKILLVRISASVMMDSLETVWIDASIKTNVHLDKILVLKTLHVSTIMGVLNASAKLGIQKLGFILFYLVLFCSLKSVNPCSKLVLIMSHLTRFNFVSISMNVKMRPHIHVAIMAGTEVLNALSEWFIMFSRRLVINTPLDKHSYALCEYCWFIYLSLRYWMGSWT